MSLCEKEKSLKELRIIGSSLPEKPIGDDEKSATPYIGDDKETMTKKEEDKWLKVIGTENAKEVSRDEL